MIVSHNLTAMNAERQFGIVGTGKKKSTEKLASGYRVNRAADDAAGLAISEKMRRQIRGLSQASKNATDGISLVQTADGGLTEVHEMLQRMNELSVKAANGTLTETDRSYIDSEVQQLKKEINRVADSTTFNEIQLFPSDGSSMFYGEYTFKVNGDGTITMTEDATSYSVGEVNASENATELAKYLKTMIPGVMNDLMGKYTSLSNAPDLTIKLNLSYIDGGNKTLAQASCRFYTSDYSPVLDSFTVKIDTADFTDSNALAGKDRNELLKSTLAHELTHTLMQYNLSKAMASKDIPKWFVEGAAQVSGGPLNTGWLYDLQKIGNNIADASDPSMDEAIAKYLKSKNIDDNVYGHGYLATAYAGYLAAGKDITKIADGLDKIMGEMMNGKSFNDAVAAATGTSVAQIRAAINGGEADVVKFAREFIVGAKNGAGYGAGSSIYGLATGDGTPNGNVPADGSASSEISPATNIYLQVGSEAGQNIEVFLFSIGTKSLGIETVSVSDEKLAGDAIEAVKGALMLVSSIRSYYGSIQNRLEHTIKNLDNVVENTTSAESAIRDTDMAKEMVELSKHNILEQAGVSIMAQANQSNQAVLALLQ